MKATATFTIPGMGSDHCAGIVSESIRRLPGIADVSTRIVSHRVWAMLPYNVILCAVDGGVGQSP